MLSFSVFQRLLTRTENRMSALSRPHAGPLDLIYEKGISYPSNRPPTQVQPRRLFNLFLEELSGLCAGDQFALVYSPEREDPGNKDFGTSTIPKVVGGLSPIALIRQLLYEKVITKVVPVSSCEAAEMTKLLENIFVL